MKKMFNTCRFYILVMVLGLISRPVAGQLVVIPGSATAMTPQQFVETYLVGSGITVSNVLLNGSAEPLNSDLRLPLKSRDQIGSFTAAGDALDQLHITGGVILSSGYAVKAVAGVNTPVGDDMWGTVSPPLNESDPDLLILAGSTINDKCILEFDFIPQTDVVTFNYVFGSREFDEFCWDYNDAFGLFLSGPDISGGAGFINDAVNIALMPGIANFVTINNICDYDGNKPGNGVYSWRNDYIPRSFSYDRLTHVFSATYTVQCNQTYHMKFGIADALDSMLDTGVFLEQNSFTSNNVTSTTTFSNPLTGQLLVEGCNEVSLVYSITLPKAENLDIDLFIHSSGTAGQADILPNPFPVKATIQAGQLQSAPIVISAVNDGIPDGTESLVIKGTPPIICGVDNSIVTTFQVNDLTPLTAELDNATLCDGSGVVLNPVVTGGQPVIPSNTFNYQWTTGATTSSIAVNPPPGHHTYSVTITDACNQLADKTANVDVGTTPAAAGPITTVPGTICTPASGIVFSVLPVNGADSYIWELPPGAVITNGEGTASVTVSFPTNAASGNITVRGHSNYCGDGPVSSLPVSVYPAPGTAGPVTGPTPVCQGSAPQSYSVPALPFATSYEWTLPHGTVIESGAGTHTISCLFPPGSSSGAITVRGYNNECLFGDPALFDLVVNPLPGNAGTIFSSSGAEVCQYQEDVPYSIAPVPDATGYQWTYSGTGATLESSGPGLLIDFSSAASSGVLMVTPTNACGDGVPSAPFPVTVKPRPTVTLNVCNALTTTRNGSPIVLKGVYPGGNGETWLGPEVSMEAPGIWTFNPGDAGVSSGTSTTAASNAVTFRYTNEEGCYDEKNLSIRVFASNATDPCPGTIRDVRDGKVYRTFQAGTGVNSRCWMGENLNFGDFTDDNLPQSDNCLDEKYCSGNQSAGCNSTGGYYQWEEVTAYAETPAYQDLCPPGWHLPSGTEWEYLVNANQGAGVAGGYLKDPMLPDHFNGLLAGIYYQNARWSFQSGAGAGDMYWTSDLLPGGKALARGLNFSNLSVSSYPASRAHAFSVRCVRN